MSISQSLDFVFLRRIASYDFSCCPFPFVFSASLPFLFHILSGCRLKMVLNYGQSLEEGLGLIIGIMSHFTIVFTTKLITFFNLLRQNVDCCADRSILALPSTYEECLVTFKLMTSQVVPRTWPLSSLICK